MTIGWVGSSWLLWPIFDLLLTRGTETKMTLASLVAT